MLSTTNGQSLTNTLASDFGIVIGGFRNDTAMKVRNFRNRVKKKVLFCTWNQSFTRLFYEFCNLLFWCFIFNPRLIYQVFFCNTVTTKRLGVVIIPLWTWKLNPPPYASKLQKTNLYTMIKQTKNDQTWVSFSIFGGGIGKKWIFSCQAVQL